MKTKKLSVKKRVRGKSTYKKNISPQKLKTLIKLRKNIDSKIKKYKKQKRTNNVKKTKRKYTSKSQEKGGLKIISKIKKFIRQPTYMTPTPPSMSELGRYTIRGPDDVELLESVTNKINEIEKYNNSQPYCIHCEDADNGCVMCHQHN